MSKYDPTKQYQWKMDDEITFSGQQFNILSQSLTQFITSNMDVPTILKLTEAFAVVQAKMSEYVDKGVIKEYVAPPDDNSSTR